MLTAKLEMGAFNNAHRLKERSSGVSIRSEAYSEAKNLAFIIAQMLSMNFNGQLLNLVRLTSLNSKFIKLWLLPLASCVLAHSQFNLSLKRNDFLEEKFRRFYKILELL